MHCAYCHNEWTPAKYHPKTCAFCGATKPEKDYEKSDPFYYAGYIVWSLRSTAGAWWEFVFYKGITHIGTVRWSLRRMMQYWDGTDIMPFVLRELEYDLGITQTPVIEIDLSNQIHFVMDITRIALLDKDGIADEIDRLMADTFGRL